MNDAVEKILTFWFGPGFLGKDNAWPDASVSKLWFSSTAADDARMAAEFGELVQQALDQQLDDWADDANGLLALIILLDQFPRNIFRGTAKAFAGDVLAADWVKRGIVQGQDVVLPWVGQVFFYMPLMHAESVADQQQCIACFEQLKQRIPDVWKANIDNNLRFAHEHLQVIEAFGRFPHRNQALGRSSTPQELDYLETANRYGQ